jgi:hypothetical protein
MPPACSPSTPRWWDRRRTGRSPVLQRRPLDHRPPASVDPPLAQGGGGRERWPARRRTLPKSRRPRHALQRGGASDVGRDESAWTRNRTRDTGIFSPAARVDKTACTQGKACSEAADCSAGAAASCLLERWSAVHGTSRSHPVTGRHAGIRARGELSARILGERERRQARPAMDRRGAHAAPAVRPRPLHSPATPREGRGRLRHCLREATREGPLWSPTPPFPPLVRARTSAFGTTRHTGCPGGRLALGEQVRERPGGPAWPTGGPAQERQGRAAPRIGPVV